MPPRSTTPDGPSRTTRASSLATWLERWAPDEPTRWAGLVAVWVHVGLLAGSEVIAPSGAAEPELVRPVTRVSAPAVPALAPYDDAAPPRASGHAQAVDVDATAPPRVAPPSPAPLPAPAVDPPEAPVRYVRTDGAALATPVDSDRIAARNTAAEQEARAIVTADDLGPRRDSLGGDAASDGGDGTRVRTARSEPGGGGGAPAEGGGAHGRDAGLGAPGDDGPRQEGGDAALAGRGLASGRDRGGDDGAWNRASDRPLRSADAGRHPVAGWAPVAFRPAPPDPEPIAATSGDRTPASTAREDGRALRDRVGRRADLGGTAMVAEQEAPPTSRVGQVGAPHGRGDRPVDPVADLRQALGWGDLDRDGFAPRPEWAGAQASPGAAPTAPQTVFDDLAIDWSPAVTAKGTPLGVYVERVERLVADRWRELDLDLDSRAEGVGGQVVVRYVVHASGLVTDVTVARSSGYPALDSLARAAVPDRLPRIPREVQAKQFFHEITLRYRNPQVVTGTNP